jgi:NADH-quinone oxidoreductase subunit M
VAAGQKDAKKLIAYSSVSHLGFIVLGLFAFSQEAVQGALIQMINHGLSTGALFLLIGMLYERRHTRMMEDYGGIARTVPVLTFFMVVTCLASVGLPGLNGFVGEFLILLGSFSSEVVGNPILIALATSGVIFAAYYLLWFLYRTFFGSIRHEENRNLADLNLREIAMLVPLVVFMVWIGVAPRAFLEPSEQAVASLLENMEEKRQAVLDASEEDAFAFTWTGYESVGRMASSDR